MKRYWSGMLLLPMLAGCMDPAPMAPKCWSIGFDEVQSAASVGAPNGGRSARPQVKGQSVRISRVDVNSPYGDKRLVVLRKDGTIAFDAYNVFVAQPSSLILAASEKFLKSDGRLGEVVSCFSSAKSTFELEIDITQLCLDCREEGKRTARVSLDVALVDGRTVISTASGAGEAALQDNIATSFSKALSAALERAVSGLKVK